MTARKLNQGELSRAAGVSQAHISRLLSGRQRWISPEDLARISAVLGTDKHDRADLLRAHLLDECTGDAADLIEVTLRDGAHGLTETYRPASSPLPAKLEEAFDLLRANADDPDLRSILLGLASWLKKDEK